MKPGRPVRLDAEGELHEGFSIAVGDELTRVDMKGLTGGGAVVCYGQVDITRDFMDSRLDYYLGTEAGRRVIAEQYVGLPYESPSG